MILENISAQEKGDSAIYTNWIDGRNGVAIGHEPTRPPPSQRQASPRQEPTRQYQEPHRHTPMSSTFETLVFNGLEKGHGDAKGEDDLPKDAFVDDSGVCPDIDNKNMAIPNDNHLNRTLLDQEFNNLLNILTTTTPNPKSSHIKREVQSGSVEGSTFVKKSS